MGGGQTLKKAIAIGQRCVRASSHIHILEKKTARRTLSFLLPLTGGWGLVSHSHEVPAASAATTGSLVERRMRCTRRRVSGLCAS